MSDVANQSLDVAGPITGKVVRMASPDVILLPKGRWVTLIPSADMTILLAPTLAEAAAVSVAQVVPAADGTFTADVTSGITIVGGQRFDFRVPNRLGKRGECFMGTLGAGELQMWFSDNLT